MMQGPGQPLRAILDSVFAAPRYHWVTRPDPFAVIRHWWQMLTVWFNSLDDKHPLGYELLIAALVIMLLGIVAHSGWIFFRTIRRADNAAIPHVDHGIRRDQEWYRREADRLADQGHFAEAMQADFLALVLALDARQALRFHPSKTPAEYAQEWRIASTRDEFRELVGRLYGYAFARWPCGPADFVEWRTRSMPDRYAPAH
jgi:hypothetical protein